MMKVLKEKQIENQYNLAKTHAEEQMKRIKEETQKNIAFKRHEIKKKINEMRKKSIRKKNRIRE